jgi:hypothetical protein
VVQSRDRGQEVSFFGRKARSRSLVGGKFSPVAVAPGLELRLTGSAVKIGSVVRTAEVVHTGKGG